MAWRDRLIGNAVFQSNGAVTHLPMPTLDNKQMMEMFKKAWADGGSGGMFGGGWQGALSSRYRTGPNRLSALQNSYGGTSDSVIWVFACVSLIAWTLGSYPYSFTQIGDETVVEPEQVPADLRALLDKPNPDWTYLDLLENVATDLELVGNAYILKNEQNALGQPKSLFRLRPDRVQIAVAPDGTEIGYVYSTAGGQQVPYDRSEVVHFRYPNPLDDHYGMGTVEAISTVLDEHTAQRQHVTGFFQNGARISGVLTVPETMTDTQFERLKASWRENYAGPANAYKILIAEGAADYKAISQSPVAAGVVDLSKLNKDEILAGFGVPAPLLGGVMENANYKMEESQHIFLRAMIPRARRVAERLSNDLVQLWGLDLRIDAHANEPMEVRIAHAQEMIKAGASLNQSLDAMGLPRSDHPLADEPLITNDLIPFSIVGQPPRPARSIPIEGVGESGSPALPPGTEAPPLVPGEPDASVEKPTERAPGAAGAIEPALTEMHDALGKDAEADRLAAIESQLAELRRTITSETPVATRNGRDARSASKAAAAAWRPSSRARTAKAARTPESGSREAESDDDWHPPEFPTGFEPISSKLVGTTRRAVRAHQAAALHAGVAVFEPTFKDFFREQRERVVGALSSYGTSGAHRRSGKAKSDLSAGGIFDSNAEDAALRDRFLPALDEVGKSILPQPLSLGAGIGWDVANPRIAALRTGLGDQITRVNQTTKDAISQQVAEGLRRGYSVVQIANGVPAEEYGGVVGVFDQASGYRAETIARTESAYAYNGAQAADFKEAAIERVEILDGEGDDECAAANGSVWTVDDYEANPLEHPNAIFEGTRVLALGEIEKGYAARWRGPAILLTTASSNDVLAVTPNHPVLTGRGWVRACEVCEGDDVVRCGGRVPVGVRSPDPDVDDVPAAIEEVLDALRRSGLAVFAVPSGADLHHDGCFVEGEVDVVVPDRPLADVPYAAVVEENRELVLARSGVKRETFARPGSLLLRSDRVPLAAAAGVPALLRGAEDDAALSQALSDEVRAEPELLGDLRDRFAVSVELDRVVDVGFEADRCGHVFDLQTAGRAYFADGILLSNCSRCAVPTDAPLDDSSGEATDTGGGGVELPTPELPAPEPASEPLLAADSPEAAASIEHFGGIATTADEAIADPILAKLPNGFQLARLVAGQDAMDLKLTADEIRSTQRVVYARTQAKLVERNFPDRFTLFRGTERTEIGTRHLDALTEAEVRPKIVADGVIGTPVNVARTDVLADPSLINDYETSLFARPSSLSEGAYRPAGTRLPGEGTTDLARAARAIDPTTATATDLQGLGAQVSARVDEAIQEVYDEIGRVRRDQIALDDEIQRLDRAYNEAQRGAMVRPGQNETDEELAAARARMDEAERALHEAQLKQSEIDQRAYDLQKSIAPTREKTIADALAEIRPMGGEVQVDYRSMQNDSGVARRVLSQQEKIPSAWIDASNASGKMVAIPVSPTEEARGARSYYGDGEHVGRLETGDFTIALSAGAKEPTALHEISHRMERVVPDLQRIEEEFVRGRIVGTPTTERLRVITGDSAFKENEIAYRTTWSENLWGHAYMGKVYARQDALLAADGSTVFVPGTAAEVAGELFTMGQEATWFNKYGIWENDRAYVDLILGMLAVL